MDSWRGMKRKMLGVVLSRKTTTGDYELLPAAEASYRPYPRRRCSWAWRPLAYALVLKITIRRVLITTALVPILLTIAILCSGVPPNFDDIRQYERRLPQHNITHIRRHQRYLRFPGHLWGHGFNNILQETILMSYLAYLSNMSYVFEDYTWSHIPLPYTIYDFALRPTHVPMNAFISGPTAGGPMDADRAISAEFWEKLCGEKTQRQVISSAYAPNDADGDIMLDWWMTELAATTSSCVEVDSSPHDVFDRFFFGGPRLLSVWDGLSKSPMLRDFTWSPLVLSAIERNFAHLPPDTPESLYKPSSSSVFSGMLAVHLRRGDYQRHCPNLAKWGARYMGMNQHPSLPDTFDPTPYTSSPHQVLEDYYLEHCYPSIEQLVLRLHPIRIEHPGLRRVYLLSNGWAWWLDELKAALEEDGWEEMVSSADVVLDAEQFYVSMAVDMAIAEKAEVFLGNGFSSLTSNLVMLRLAKGLDPSTIRFL